MRDEGPSSGGPSSAAVRAEVLRFVDEAWDPEAPLVEWRRRLFTAGWACPPWPLEFGGRAWPAATAEWVADALAAAGVPGPPDAVGMHLAAPTLLEHGSDELKHRYLAQCATGEHVWCQLFSEPGAGSDLAGLGTRADAAGGGWVVSGQKVWNTGAHHADFGLLLARTDWDVPKHAGLTAFVLPMRQAGIEVRPLRQMNGHASFNEVFLDEALVPAGQVLGQVGHGWSVALTTLAHERRLTPTRRGVVPRDPGGRVWREAAAEQRQAAEPYRWYPQRAGRVDLLAPRARAAGRADDRVVREEVARTEATARTAAWTSARAAAARALGRPPGPEGSLGKLATSVIARAAARTHTAIAGPSGMLAGPDAPLDGTVTEVLVSVPAQSIAGGTDEIQRNILAERLLGLPREPAADRDLPFRLVPRNA